MPDDNEESKDGVEKPLESPPSKKCPVKKKDSLFTADEQALKIENMKSVFTAKQNSTPKAFSPIDKVEQKKQDPSLMDKFGGLPKF